LAVRVFDQADHMSCPRLKRIADETPAECDDFECNHTLWSFNGEDLVGCPIKMITQQSGEFVRAYRFFKYGLLPRSGGLIDQGMRYVQAMEAIDREVNLIEREAQEKE